MKHIRNIIFMLGAVCLFSSASSVSWEGRAVIADPSRFPDPGKYAQSRVFSKGEIVEVYNPSNDPRTTVVITGSSDVSGVLIMLSPEAASDLSISQGHDAVVRVNKKSVYSEPSILGTDTDAAAYVPDPDVDPEAAIQIARAAAGSDVSGTSPEEPAAGEIPAAVPEDVTAYILPEDGTGDGLSGEETAVSAETSAVAEEDETAVLAEHEMLLPSEKETAALVPPVPAEEAAAEEDTVVLAEDTVEAPASPASVLPEAGIAEGDVKEPEETGVMTENTVENVPDPFYPSVITDEPELAIVSAELPVETEEEDGALPDEFDLTLFPADMFPPEPVQVAEETDGKTAPAAETSAAGNPAASRTLPAELASLCIDSLSGNEYYVQIATLGDIHNISSVVASYGNKYPIRLMASGDGLLYQVFVGPLTKDESGAVLERFRRGGFPDAFVKKQ